MSVLAPPRPDWTTVRRPHLRARPWAAAAGRATCPSCSGEVYPDQPIYAVGASVVQEPDGSRTVDLSGVEWICCPAVAA